MQLARKQCGQESSGHYQNDDGDTKNEAQYGSSGHRDHPPLNYTTCTVRRAASEPFLRLRRVRLQVFTLQVTDFFKRRLPEPRQKPPIVGADDTYELVLRPVP